MRAPQKPIVAIACLLLVSQTSYSASHQIATCITSTTKDLLTSSQQTTSLPIQEVMDRRLSIPVQRPPLAVPTLSNLIDHIQKNASKAGARLTKQRLENGIKETILADGRLEILSHEPLVFGIFDQKNGFFHEFDLKILNELKLGLKLKEVDRSFERIRDLPYVFTPHPVHSHARLAWALEQTAYRIESQGNFFHGPALYEHFAARPQDFEPVLRRWYPAEADVALKSAANIPEAHRALLLDPAILRYRQQFLEYYKQKTPSSEKPAHLVRKEFSDYLEKDHPENQKAVFIWRGISLDEKKLKDIEANGFRPGLLREGTWPTDKKRDTLLRLLSPEPSLSGGFVEPNGFSDAIGVHLQGNTEATPFVSTTHFIEVAHLGAWDKIDRGYYDGRFHLFKIKLPRLDLIRYDGPFQSIGENFWVKNHKDPDYVTRSLDGNSEFRHKMRHPDHEYLVDYVPRSAIEEIVPYNNPPPPWELQVPPEKK